AHRSILVLCELLQLWLAKIRRPSAGQQLACQIFPSAARPDFLGANGWRPRRPPSQLYRDLPSVTSLLATCARILGDVLERDQPRPIDRAVAFTHTQGPVKIRS